ncbi:MAG: hypothetical protein DRP12_01365 [Candidatus Aenigmatarchaeota archaeon]|nr:MAG: hypothetical protein DRP12_01365 [Candidatus Aenigmarchaeota archaeon]
MDINGYGINFFDNRIENINSTKRQPIIFFSTYLSKIFNNTFFNIISAHTAYRRVFLLSGADNLVANNTFEKINSDRVFGVVADNNEISGNIFNNTGSEVNYSIWIQSGTGNVFHHNYFYNSQIEHAHSEVAGNHFNTTGSGARGNYWDDIESLEIYDADGDGYGDSGPDYPYSKAKGGKVSDYIVDYGPIIFDITPPVITIISPENKTYGSSSIWANISLNEPGSWAAYSLDGQPNVSLASADQFNWSKLMTGLTEGQHNITFWANDTAGNMNHTGYVYFTVDTSLPIITLVPPTPENNSHVNRNWVYINATVQDDTAVDACWLELNGTNYTMTKEGSGSSVICWFNATNLLDNLYVGRVWANDTVGNAGSSETRWIWIDTTPPTITIISPENKSYNISSIWANISANEPCSSVNYSLDGQPNVTMDSSDSFYWSKLMENLPDGRHNITFWAKDVAGNLNHTGYVYFTVDLSGPFWSNNKTQPSSPVTYQPSASYQFNITWTDPAGVDLVYIQANFSGSWQNYTPTKAGDEYYLVVSSLPAGLYSWGSWANDTVGNTNSTPRWIYQINKAGSSCQLQFDPASPQTYPVQLNVSCSCTNPEAQPRLYRNGTDVTAENNQYVQLPAGTWHYVCNVTETQNYTGAEISATYQIDPAQTQLTLQSQPSWSVTYPTEINVSCQANNQEVLLELYRNDSLVASGYGLVYEKTTLSVGSYNYTCNTSGSQNWTSASASHLLTVTPADINPPGITLVPPTPENNSHINRNWVYINATVQDDTAVDACWLEVNGTNYTMFKTGSGSFVICWLNATNLADDLYIGKVWANDTYGNAGSSETRWIWIDTTPPKLLNIRNESVTSSSAIIKWDTDEEANSTVLYGKTQALGSERSSSQYVLNHSITLTGLESDTVYYWNISSCDRAGNCNSSGIYSFRTALYQPPKWRGGGGVGGWALPISYLYILVNETPQEVKITPRIIVMFKVAEFDEITRSLKWVGTEENAALLKIVEEERKYPLNSRVDIDLNKDGQNDIWITVTQIDSQLTFLIAKIPQPKPPAKICQPGELRCYQDELQRCNQTGTGWELVEKCPYGCVNLTCLQQPQVPLVPGQPPSPEVTSLLIAIASLALLSGIFYVKRRLRKSLKEVMEMVYQLIREKKTDYQIRQALQKAGLGTRSIDLILQEMRKKPNKLDRLMERVEKELKAGKKKKQLKKELLKEGWPKEIVEMALK